MPPPIRRGRSKIDPGAQRRYAPTPFHGASELHARGKVSDRADEVGGVAAEAGFQSQFDKYILIIVDPEGRGDGKHLLMFVHGFGRGSRKAGGFGDGCDNCVCAVCPTRDLVDRPGE